MKGFYQSLLTRHKLIRYSNADVKLKKIPEEKDFKKWCINSVSMRRKVEFNSTFFFAKKLYFYISVKYL